MTKFQILGAAALALVAMASDAAAQRGGGAVRTGARGAGVGGIVGGEAGAATGAKVGAVTGAARSVSQEAQARSQYQSTAAYQSAPHSDFNQAPPQVLAPAAPAVTAPVAAAPAAPGGETVLRKSDKPVAGVTFPSDWKLATGDRYISGVSVDGQAYAMIATVEGTKDKKAAVDKIKQGLLNHLQDIKYDDMTETKRGGLLVTGAGKGKKAGVDVVFAAGVLDAGEGQLVGVAFVIDSKIEDYYKETVRQICRSIRVGGDFTGTKPVQPKAAATQ